jgi:hypothetical protein
MVKMRFAEVECNLKSRELKKSFACNCERNEFVLHCYEKSLNRRVYANVHVKVRVQFLLMKSKEAEEQKEKERSFASRR